VIVRQRLHAVLGIAVAVCAAALLLSACGGAAAKPDSTRSETAGRSETTQTPPDVGTIEHPESSRESGQKKRHKSGGPGPITAEAAANPEHQTGSGRRHGNPEGCPRQLSRQQCAQLAEAGEQPGAAGSHGAQPTECPQALSRAECRELTEIHRQNGEGGQTTTEECPPALTAAQCQELEGAYEEANR